MVECFSFELERRWGKSIDTPTLKLVRDQNGGLERRYILLWGLQESSLYRVECLQSHYKTHVCSAITNLSEV